MYASEHNCGDDMSLCRFVNGACAQCGIRNKSGFPDERLRRNCRETSTANCLHLGEETGAVELIRCETCNGNVRLKFPVHACAVNGLCLPTFAGNGESKLGCRQCRDDARGFTPRR